MKTLIVYLSVLLFGIMYVEASERPAFTSEMSEQQSGLIYLRNRNYDPEIGSFTTKDPIGVAGGLNSYQYCNANPVNNQDPLGLVTPVDTAVAAVVGGGIGLVSQGVGDLVFQRPLQWQNYAASAAGGATTGALLVNTFNPVLAGAAGGAAANTVRQISNIATGQQQSYSPTNMATEVMVSGAFTMGGSALGAAIKSNGQTASMQIVASKIAMPKLSSGPAVHFVYAVGDSAADAVGPGFLQMTTRSLSSTRFNQFAENSFGSINVPIAAANASLVTQSGLPAANCATATASALIRGWFSQPGSYIGFGVKIGLDPSGILIDKAAELVGSNLADIKGATY